MKSGVLLQKRSLWRYSFLGGEFPVYSVCLDLQIQKWETTKSEQWKTLFLKEETSGLENTTLQWIQRGTLLKRGREKKKKG